MELWIRSQDREGLIKVNDSICIIDYGDEYFRQISIDNLQIGVYRTKERALEVLDEIQKILCPPMNFIVGCNILKEEPKIEQISDVIVYEMPKE